MITKPQFIKKPKRLPRKKEGKKKEKKMKMKKIIAVIALTLVTALSTSQLFAFVYANHTCITYNACDPQNENKSITGTTPNIGELVIAGTGYFLQSHADMLLFLHNIGAR
jgi:hypothetical protein